MARRDTPRLGENRETAFPLPGIEFIRLGGRLPRTTPPRRSAQPPATLRSTGLPEGIDGQDGVRLFAFTLDLTARRFPVRISHAPFPAADGNPR
jgi:hypothetical protein